MKLGNSIVKLLIVGSGSHIGNVDVTDCDVMAVNKEIIRYPNATHHVSLHNIFSKKPTALKHSNKPYPLVDCCWAIQSEGGSSGLLATQIALNMGYSKVALYGIYIIGSYGDNVSRQAWRTFKSNNELQCSKRLRSYHGFTKELFGNAKGWF